MVEDPRGHGLCSRGMSNLTAEQSRGEEFTNLQALSVSMSTGIQQYLHLKLIRGVPSGFCGRGGTVILSSLVTVFPANDVLVS